MLTAVVPAIQITSGQISIKDRAINIPVGKSFDSTKGYDAVPLLTLISRDNGAGLKIAAEPDGHVHNLMKKHSVAPQNLSQFPRFASAVKVLLGKENISDETLKSAVGEYAQTLPDVSLVVGGVGFKAVQSIEDKVKYVTNGNGKAFQDFQYLAEIFSKQPDKETLFANRLIEVGILGESISMLAVIVREKQQRSSHDLIPSGVLSHEWDNFIGSINQQWERRGIIPEYGLAGRGGALRERFIDKARS